MSVVREPSVPERDRDGRLSFMALHLKSLFSATAESMSQFLKNVIGGLGNIDDSEEAQLQGGRNR